MLERHVTGEPEEFARLRGSIVKVCDIEHFNKVMTILREDAKKRGISFPASLYVWEVAHTPDLTAESGMSEYNRVYSQVMGMLD